MICAAILGAGIGVQHLEAYRALSDRFQVSLIVDRDAARARGRRGPRPTRAGGARPAPRSESWSRAPGVTSDRHSCSTAQTALYFRVHYHIR